MLTRILLLCLLSFLICGCPQAAIDNPENQNSTTEKQNTETNSGSDSKSPEPQTAPGKPVEQDDKKPATDDKKPATDDKKPATEDKKPDTVVKPVIPENKTPASGQETEIKQTEKEITNQKPKTQNTIPQKQPEYIQHEHDFVYEYIGNACHKMYCSLCGIIVAEKQYCTTSFLCKDCGYNSKTTKYDTNFFEINEQIKKLYIVASTGFENSKSLQKYIQYKKDNKFEVEAFYFESNVKPEEIRNKLKSEYQKNPDMAVLIVGRGGTIGNNIPEFVNKNQPDIQGIKRVAATDFWYGFYEDRTDNLFPQVMVGRLSAMNETQLEAQVNKIIKMETNAKGVKNNKIVLIQQKNDAGKMPFHEETEKIQNYFNTYKKDLYDLNLVYTNQPDNVNNAINKEPLFLSYTGHGGPDFLGDSRYNITYVKQLKNNYYPVVLGITCNSANYTYGDECIAEAFMRNPAGGAVGYIGASAAMISDYSRIASIGHNDIPGAINSFFMIDGQYKNNTKVKTLGGLFLAALRAIKISKFNYSDISRGYSIEVLNLFGDPTMRLDYGE